MEYPHDDDGDLVISIQEKLEAARCEDYAAHFPRNVSIYRVPPNLTEQSDPGAYTPQFVSLGPYHHGSPRLLQMERHKWRAFCLILSRNNQEINIYVDSMKQLEYEARACYEGEFELSSNKFSEMMLFDGCFILEILQGNSYGFETLGYDENDPIFSSQGIITYSIERDMIMLENQIPLVVLDKLLRLQPNFALGLVAELARQFLELLGPFRLHYPLSTAFLSRDYQDSHHLLDIIRRSFYRGLEVASNRTVPARLDHCVTEIMKDAGIKVKLRDTHRLLDIVFHDGTLHIPPILIDDGTKSLLKNLIAFEQCHHCKKDITSYVVFLDGLIDTAEDVRCLRRYEIIEHWLGSDEKVAILFNCLGKEVILNMNDNSFSHLSKEIKTYYCRKRKWKWNSWLADLKHRYFKNPWTILSHLSGVLLLLLTAVQAFYVVYTYYLPNN